MPDQQLNHSSRKPILRFCLMTGAFWFSQYAYMPQLTRYASQIGASMATIGLISGAYGFSQVLLRVPLGLASDFLGKRKVFVLFGIAMTVISPLMVLAAPSPATLIAARFLSGVAAAAWVNMTVMFSEYFKGSESTKAIGIINSTNRLGQLTAFVLGGIVVAAAGIPGAFVLSALTGAVALLVGIQLRDTGSREPGFKLREILRLYQNQRLVFVSILGLLSQLITFSTVYSFTPLIATELGAKGYHLNLYTILFMLPQILFAALAGTVIKDRFGERLTLSVGFSIVMLCSFITPFLTHYLQLFPVMLLCGIGNALSFPLLMGIAIQDVSLGYKTSAMGFYQSVYAIGMTAGPIGIGIISGKFGLTAGFMTAGAMGLAALGMVQLPSAGITGRK